MTVVLFESSNGLSCADGSSATTITYNHTTYGGPNTVVIGAGFCQLGGSYPGTPPGTHTMTFGGVSMTSLGTQALNNVNNDGFVELFYLFNPPAGTQSVVTTYTPGTGNYLAAATCTYQNVASLSTKTSAYGNLAAQSITVAGGLTDSVAVAVIGNDQFFTTMTSLRQKSTSAASPIWICDSILNGGSATFTGTQGGAKNWAALGVALQPVPANRWFSMFR